VEKLLTVHRISKVDYRNKVLPETLLMCELLLY